MSESTVEISIVTPAYNAEATLPRFLGSLETLVFDRGLFEVIIVDDGSSDSTLDILKSFKRETGLDFTFFTMPRSKKSGAGTARAHAISRARGPVIALTDADCVLEKGWLQTIHDEVIMNGRAVIGGDIYCDEPLIFPWKYAPVLGKGVTANLAFDRSQTGTFSFSQDFVGLFGEDIDLVLRLEKSGYPLENIERMRVFHPANIFSMRRMIRRVLWRSNEVLLRKKYGNLVDSAMHPFFRPSISGWLSPVTVLILVGAGLVFSPLWFLGGSIALVVAYLLLLPVIFSAFFVLYFYRWCVFYRPESDEHTIIPLRYRFRTLIALAVYIPLFLYSRISGSIKFRHLML